MASLVSLLFPSTSILLTISAKLVVNEIVKIKIVNKNFLNIRFYTQKAFTFKLTYLFNLTICATFITLISWYLSRS